MKITRVTTEVRTAVKEHAVRDAIQLLDLEGHCIVRIESEDGVVGRSDTYFGREDASPYLLAQLVERLLAPAVVGTDAMLVRQIRGTLQRLTDYQGTAGLSTLGIAAIDVALWDLLGRAVQRPVWQLLGAARSEVPTYAMVGWLELDLDQLQRVTATAVGQGFRGVKIKVGGGSLSDDLDRIRVVREVLGPDRALMVDANQAFDFAEALHRGRRYEELGCRWFEEPLPAADTAAHVRLAARLDIPIATGENRYGLEQFTDLFAGHGVGVVQPDLRRAGGLTACLEIGLAAHAFGIPYASHGGGPHIHVLAALPNTLFMESGLLPADGRVQLVDGCYPLPEGAGLSGWGG